MSEYQWYEFLALDRPLTAQQMAELRKVSSRAEISSTRFWNEYNFGDLKADPAWLVERYFDAHLYFANWGTHRLMLRLPATRIDVGALEPFFVDEGAVRVTRGDEYVVLEMTSDTEEPEYDEGTPSTLAELSPLRAELMRGDLRPLYLAWLLAVEQGDVEDDAPEPPVPAGLATLSPAQEAMVDFLRIDPDLVAAAAAGSAAPVAPDRAFRQWIKQLGPRQKDQWLLRAADDPDLPLGSELLRTFLASERRGGPAKRRTAGELQAMAETQREEREKAEAAREEKARQAAARARQRQLDELSHRVDAAWTMLEKLIATSEYDQAVKLALDLRDLATRDGKAAAFATRFEAMRKRQARRRGFFSRWEREGSGGATAKRGIR
jgi:hypothetical protein